MKILQSIKKHYSKFTDENTVKASPSQDDIPLPSNLKKRKSPDFTFTIALSFTIICTFWIFDINMQSSGITSDTIHPLSAPPAKRAILFISDGTKSESIFGLDENDMPYAPFLRSIVKEKGSYGVSLTSPPTESKICVSNIVTGHFFDLPDLFDMFFYDEMMNDHILNESNYSWSFGQPEIVNLFKATNGDVHRITITPNDIPIQQNESCIQNSRVIDQLEEVFKKSKDDKELDQKLRSEKVIFMVHLICVDLIGHIFKPFSEAYANEIRSTDSLIEKATQFISNFYQDDQTSFIFTSDHGMKTTGVHADDSLENIRTPFITWGTGLATPSKGPHTPLTHDEYSLPWKLTEYERKDIRQVDIAPLVACLIGIPIPVNSEGITPLEYLESDSKRKAEAGYLNAKQICSMLARREEIWEESWIRSLFTTKLREKIYDKLDKIWEYIAMEDYWAAERDNQEVLRMCIKGNENYKQSEKIVLMILFQAAYMSWVIHGLIQALINNGLSKYERLELFKRKRFSMKIWKALSSIILIFLYVWNSPYRYYLYSSFLIYFGYQIALNFENLISLVSEIKRPTKYWLFGLAIFNFILFYAYKTGCKSIFMILLLIWSIIIIFEKRATKSKSLVFSISTICLAGVLIFNKIELQDNNIYIVGWLTISLVNFIGAYIYRKEAPKSLLFISMLTFFNGILTLKIDSPSEEDRQEGSIIFWHDLAKLSLPVALAFPFVFKSMYKPRLQFFLYLLFASFSPLLVIFSLQYECLFFVAFVFTLSTWSNLEKAKAKDNTKSIQRNAVLVLMGFELFYYLSFYGIGNHVTIDSFRIDAGFRFLNGFNVLKIGLLMILKFSIPFFIFQIFFQALLKQIYPEKLSLQLTLSAISISGLMILGCFETKQGDEYHSQMTISYSLVTACILCSNVAFSGLAETCLNSVK